MTDAAVVREFVEGSLRAHSSGAGKFESFTDGVRRLARAKPVVTDAPFWNMVLDQWGELVRGGAIAIAGGPGDIPTFYVPGQPPHKAPHTDVPEWVITPLGKRLLEEKQPSPHDWAKYEGALRLRVGTPDPVVLVHLGESVRAFNASLYRSSAVMLGCAVERLIIMMAEAIPPGTPAPGDVLPKKLANPRIGISEIFDDVATVLMHMAADKKLPGGIAEALDRKLTAIFDHARALRNKSGHPTGAEVTADEALSALLLFPGFYAFVMRVIDAMRPPSTSTAPATPAPAAPGGGS